MFQCSFSFCFAFCPHPLDIQFRLIIPSNNHRLGGAFKSSQTDQLRDRIHWNSLVSYFSAQQSQVSPLAVFSLLVLLDLVWIPSIFSWFSPCRCLSLLFKFMFISVPTLLLVQPSPSQNDTRMILSNKWLHFDATYLPVFISYLHIFWCLGPPNTEICICLSCLVCVSFGSFSHLYKSKFSLIMIWNQLPFTHTSTHEGTMGWSKKKYVYNIYNYIYMYTHTI